MWFLLHALTLAAPNDGSSVEATQIIEVRSVYRACIADVVAIRPKDESPDLALGIALERCRGAELTLRGLLRKAHGSNAADTFAVNVDTRLDGQEAGIKRREAR